MSRTLDLKYCPTIDSETETNRAPEGATTGSEAPPRSWGTLRILDQIGGGGCGDVYRAFDPVLETEVALKLAKHGSRWSGSERRRFLSEARRLARVRHPNALAVRGAGDHDGRVGLWTDLVQGRSLEECLRVQGPFSASEATLIGLDLCRALAHVHAKGLVHRDVKTSNVMREEGGRIVLMDFGSMAELSSRGETESPDGVSGTLLVMPPEQLRGEAVGPRADIYALGVLLYRITTGRYPIEAHTLPGLLEGHARSARVPLRDRRADLPLGFVEVVERALSSDLEQRYPSVGAMEQALAAVAGVRPQVAVGVPAAWRALAGIAALGLIVGASGFWSLLHRTGPKPGGLQEVPVASAPQGPLAAKASLFRRVGSRDLPLSAEGAVVRPGDRLFLALRANEPMYTYVLNQDQSGNAYVLFPIQGVSPRNPLPAIGYRLPGRMGDSLVYWTVTSVGGREGIVVIGSRSPLQELEDVIARVPRASPNVPVRFGPSDPAADGEPRNIGGIVKEGVVSGDTQRRLDEMIQTLEQRSKEEGDVWIWRATLTNPAG